MKRIAFISEAFWESILPLAREFHRKGFGVDLYFMRQSIHEPLGCECDFDSKHLGINRMNDEAFGAISDFIGSKHLRAFSIALPRPFESVPLLRSISAFRINQLSKKVAAQIDKENYALVNIVANHDMDHFRPLVEHLLSRTIVSLHEVIDHVHPSSSPSILIRTALQTKRDIILFSRNSLNNITRLDGVSDARIHYIPFGTFDFYSSYAVSPICSQLPEKYFLFFGYLLGYKGLNVLYDAIDLLGNELRDYKIVIAGKHEDKSIGIPHDNDNRYIKFLRYIHNDELATLTRYAKALICPYLSMSQSGIPSMAFALGTPVIASDLEGFREIVTEDVGILFETGNAKALADTLRSFIKDTEIHRKLSENIKDFHIKHPDFDWHHICEQYISL